MLWFTMAVAPQFSWPNCRTEIEFEGHTVALMPRYKYRDRERTHELAATISVRDLDGITFDRGGTLANRFLSRLAWFEKRGVIELFCGGSCKPSEPGRLGQGTFQRSGYRQVEPWDFLEIPINIPTEAELALGLFREGMSVNSPPFAFLSFFKILNILYGKGMDQKNWINQNLDLIRYGQAKERLSELQQNNEDIGKYLYQEGRCAVAHANGTPLVNPDDYTDKKRMEKDIHLIKEVAALFIRNELGIKEYNVYKREPECDPRKQGSFIDQPEHIDKIIKYREVQKMV